MPETVDQLLKQISECTICSEHLELGPRPVVSFSKNSRILIIGQAPGTRVHASGIPWDDASGKKLRTWLDVSDEEFYNPDLFGIVPMGFCYPGKGKSGDLPPRKECAKEWHEKVLSQLPNVQLVLLIGKYAQDYYLGENSQKNLTENVRMFEKFLPNFLPLPHPSPRNAIWLKKNDWFEAFVLPTLRTSVHSLLDDLPPNDK
jgi:uracil-DNA glycosylase